MSLSITGSKRLSMLSDSSRNSCRSKPSFRERLRNHFTPAVKLDWEIDNSSSLSSGSIIHGRIIINVFVKEVEIKRLDGVINRHRTERRPCRKRCPKCKRQTTELHAWTFLTGPTTLQYGRTEFEFSALIPDDALPSLNTSLVGIAYELQATASIYKANSTRPAENAPINVKFDQEFLVQPLVHAPMLPQYLSQTIPRTNICATATFDPLVSPLGPNHVSIKFDSFVSFGQHGRDSQIWRLVQSAWTIEETVKTIPKSCTQHASLANPDEGAVEIRTHTERLGGKELYECWKTCDDDFTVDLDFDFGFKPGHKVHSRASYAGSLESPGNVEVSHSLIVELLFVLEHFPEGQPSLSIRTGKARIVRLPYQVTLVNRGSHMGSCDDRVSSYEDTFSDPPSYKKNH